jgi:protein-tyrosine-phosphatase
MKKILIVCTGNTCRSSMAEALAKDWLQKQGLDGNFLVTSAGIMATPNEEASAHAILALKEKDIHLDTHRSKQISREMLMESDLILTMTKSHKQMLMPFCEACEDKLFTLKEYALGNSGDVVDPFGQDLASYKLCRDELIELVEKAMKRIVKA